MRVKKYLPACSILIFFLIIPILDCGDKGTNQFYFKAYAQNEYSLMLNKTIGI